MLKRSFVDASPGMEDELRQKCREDIALRPPLDLVTAPSMENDMELDLKRSHDDLPMKSRKE